MMKLRPILVCLYLSGCGSNSPLTKETETDAPDWGTPPDSSGIDLSYPAPEQPLPKLNSGIDPLAMDLTAYVPGAGSNLNIFHDKHIAILRDPLDHTLPECDTAIAPPKIATGISFAADGSLSEWQESLPIAIDRVGDGIKGEAGWDLTKVYAGQDDSYFYLGIKLAGSWKPVSGGPRMTLTFAKIALPQSEDESSSWETIRRYSYSDKLYDTTRNVSVRPLPSEAIAVPGDSAIEWRVAKSQLSNLGNTYAIRVAIFDQDFLRSDEIGSHIVGAADDYACIVQMPRSGRKMFVMRRDPTIPAEVAESSYRAVIRGAQAVESALDTGFAAQDTIPVTVVVAMRNEGAYATNSGIYMRSIVHDGQARRRMREDFSLGAHEYAHTLNTSDYALPKRWMAEGHSEWAAKQALVNYYGPPLQRFEVVDFIRGFKQGESEAYTDITNDSWPNGNHSIRDHYNKAAVFFELFSRRFPYPTLLKLISRGMQGDAYTGNGDFLTTLTSDKEFNGTSSPTMWDQWFSNVGSYATSLFPTEQLSDEDGDGLFLYQEISASTDPQNADSDGDGISDAFELYAGLDPKVSQAPTHLAIDHLLGDWETLYPNSLTEITGEPDGGINCGSSSFIKRYAVAFDGDFLAIAVELGDVPEPSQHRALTLSMTESSGRIVDVGVRSDSSVVFGWDEQKEQNLASAKLLAEPRGKTVEFYYHRSWLGWGNSFPSGLEFKIYSYGGEGDAKKICHRATGIKPFFAF